MRLRLFRGFSADAPFLFGLAVERLGVCALWISPRCPGGAERPQKQSLLQILVNFYRFKFLHRSIAPIEQT